MLVKVKLSILSEYGPAIHKRQHLYAVLRPILSMESRLIFFEDITFIGWSLKAICSRQTRVTLQVVGFND